MKKLLYIILLLPLWVNAQTNGTIQKTSATGTIRGSFGSLGLDTLLNVNAPTNGFVPVYNSTLKKSIWTNPTSFTPTISFGTFGSTPNAQGGSYSGGVITLQPADATHPGGVSTTTQTIKGNKTIINDTDAENTLLTLRNNVNSNGSLSRFKIESNSDNALTFTINSNLYDGGAYGGQSGIAASGGTLNISAQLSGSTVPVKITKPSVVATDNLSWTTLVSLATSERTATLQDASGTIAFTSDIPTNYWTRTGIVLSPSTTNDVISVTTTTLTAITGTATTGIAISGTASGNGYGAQFYSGTNGVAVYAGGNGAGGYFWNSSTRGTLELRNSGAGRTLEIQNTAGTPTAYFDNTGALTGTSATFSGGLKWGASTFESGIAKLYTDTEYGVNLVSKTGSITDFLLLSPSGGQILSVPTGTNNILHNGFFKSSDDGTYAGSANPYHEFRSSTSSNTIVQFSNTSANPYGLYVRHSTSTNNNVNYFFEAIEVGTTRFSFYTNGGIANFQANNVNLSDERVKKNITKAGSYWDIIKAIEFDNYKYKDQKDNRMLLGVMAQQVEKINPAWVSNSGSFGKASDGTNLKSVYEQQLQYGVNIVVQESMKRIEALEAEVNLLKSK